MAHALQVSGYPALSRAFDRYRMDPLMFSLSRTMSRALGLAALGLSLSSLAFAGDMVPAQELLQMARLAPSQSELATQWTEALDGSDSIAFSRYFRFDEFVTEVAEIFAQEPHQLSALRVPMARIAKQAGTRARALTGHELRLVVELFSGEDAFRAFRDLLPNSGFLNAPGPFPWEHGQSGQILSHLKKQTRSPKALLAAAEALAGQTLKAGLEPSSSRLSRHALGGLLAGLSPKLQAPALDRLILDASWPLGSASSQEAIERIVQGLDQLPKKEAMGLCVDFLRTMSARNTRKDRQISPEFFAALQSRLEPKQVLEVLDQVSPQIHFEDWKREEHQAWLVAQFRNRGASKEELEAFRSMVFRPLQFHSEWFESPADCVLQAAEGIAGKSISGEPVEAEFRLEELHRTPGRRNFQLEQYRAGAWQRVAWIQSLEAGDTVEVERTRISLHWKFRKPGAKI